MKNLTKPVIVPYTLQLKHQQIIKLINCLSYQKFVPLLRFCLWCVKAVNTAKVYSHHVPTISKTSFVRTAFYIQKLASFVKEVHMNLVEVANSVNNVFAVGDLYRYTTSLIQLNTFSHNLIYYN